MGITVAVTGPTGAIGVSTVEALERDPDVDHILGMGRRAFDPTSRGWAKTDYRRGDVTDQGSVEALVSDADVVVHLAFQIMGGREQTRLVNLAGARNVFEATVAAPRPTRLVYTSSVAAYGYHRDNPVPLTEDLPPRGSAEHYYSQQKAEIEQLLKDVTGTSMLEVYVLRPCIVAGPTATVLADFMPWNRLGGSLGSITRAFARAIPPSRPLFPDPGVTVQLIHPDDVATALVAAVHGRGPSGSYNLAADGEVTLTDVAEVTGGRGVRIPHVAAVAASEVLARTPRVPWVAEWIHVGRTSMVMDTSKAKREFGWQPAYSSQEALAAMAEAMP